MRAHRGMLNKSGGQGTANLYRQKNFNASFPSAHSKDNNNNMDYIKPNNYIG